MLLSGYNFKNEMCRLGVDKKRLSLEDSILDLPGFVIWGPNGDGILNIYYVPMSRGSVRRHVIITANL